MKYVLTIIGARPQFVKAAIVSKALAKVDIEEKVIHTGQHYDYEMSTVFWEELNLPSPSANLDVGSGMHGEQTGIMLIKLEEYILNLPKLPSALLVYGDTNSTLAGALVASKLHIPVIHVEAGLRSFNRNMPEEINRIVTDHISKLLFCSSDSAVQQLKKEGVSEGIFNVGDVMYDALLAFSEIAVRKNILSEIIPFKKNEFYLATIHRPSNTDSEENLEAILAAFSKLDKPVIWPVHPRNKKYLAEKDIHPNIYIINPLSYFKMMVVLQNSYKVITDSGGLQKEAYWMKKQCVTVRNETEWIETLDGSWNTLTGANTSAIIDSVNASPTEEWKNLYGDGDASTKIAAKINEYISNL